jgi:hypothetical protein
VDQELKRKWVEALRSGKYQQTQGLLNRTIPSEGKPAGMCCLGVLCDVIDPEGWVVVDSMTKGFRNSDTTGYLPEDLSEDLDGRDILLAHRNDAGATFEELADYIEANL